MSEEKKLLNEEELNDVSGGSIGTLMTETEIHDTLKRCGDLAWDRNHWSVLWSNINYAQVKGMNQERLNGINSALDVLKAEGLTNGLNQADYDTLLSDLLRCKKAMELALAHHRI